jgi:hypothetical protein
VVRIAATYLAGFDFDSRIRDRQSSPSAFSGKYWDITICRQLLIHSCFHVGFLLHLFFDTEDEGDMFFFFTFNGSHGVIASFIHIRFKFIIYNHPVIEHYIACTLEQTSLIS